jgi:hypothetical protein
MLIVILTYDLSFDQKFFQILEDSLNSSLVYVQQNFLIISHYILTKVSIESRSNIWVQKLSLLLQQKLKSLKRGDNVNTLRQNNDQIKKIIMLIFKYIII